MKKSAVHRIERRAFERCGHRVSCILELDGVFHRASILDVSPRGLFVQTAAPLPEGSTLRVVLVPCGEPVVDVEAKVVRRRSSRRSTAAACVPGLGVEVLAAPERYFQLVLDWMGPWAPPALPFSDP